MNLWFEKMSLSSNFEATIENAPCPPFFVENVYDIFINTAANNNLTANVTEEVWSKCTLQYPYPTTTTTTTTLSTTSTTEQTTTTTPKQTTTTTPKQTTTTTTTPRQTTTTTPKQTTTTTPKQMTTTTTPKQTTTTTPKQTTTTTTPRQTTTTPKITTTTPRQTTTTPKLTTTTPKQTTIITTQETKTTTTPKQTTTATWQTTTTTQQQTTTSQKQITTTTKQTSTSTTKLTTTSATKQTSASTIKPTTSTPTSTPTTTIEQTTSLTTSSSEAVTRSPATFILSSKCDTVCLSLALMFSVCVLLGILITLIYCNMRHRHKKHVMKHSNRPKRKISNGKYIPKFPKMSKQADLKKSPLAFINPSFLTEHEHMSDPFDYNSAEYQPIDNMYPWNHPQNDLFLEYNQPHYDLIFSSGGRQFHADEKQNDEFAKRRSRHPSIGSHVPKMLPEYSEIYPFGIEVYDTSSRNNGLPKIDLDYNNADEKIDTVIREHKLPRIPFENDFVSDSPYKGTDTRQDHPGEKNEEHKRGNGAFIHGLPRIPLDLEQTGGELSEKPLWQLGLPKPQIDKRYSREIEHEENYIRHPKHGLRRTPIEPSGIGHFELNKRNRREDDFADRERQNNGDNGKFKSNTYSLYQGRKDKDGNVSRVNKSKRHLKEGDTSDQSFTYSVPYTKL